MATVLQVEGVKKSCHMGKVVVPALCGVSFEVKNDEFLTIFGPSGSGKSTLLHLMGGLDRPDEGKILVCMHANFTYNVWINLTLPLISGGWSSSSSAASWNNITGLKLDFAWANSSDVTLLVDRVFFRGNFKSLLESAATAFLVNYAFLAFTQILLVWVILTGLIYLMGRGLGGSVLWKPVLIVIGFALVTMVIQSLVNTVAYLGSPAVHYPLELIGGVKGESDIAFNAILEQTWLVSQIMRFTQIAVYVWTIALCSLAVRFLTAFGWAKSFLFGTAAYLITLLAGSFLLGF
jgi:energy-coupling factor transporter ATP-binding protein EcfA2